LCQGFDRVNLGEKIMISTLVFHVKSDIIINKQQATSNKQQATSNKQQATSNKQQALSS
jgi:hypothetical protein